MKIQSGVIWEMLAGCGDIQFDLECCVFTVMDLQGQKGIFINILNLFRFRGANLH